MTWDHPDNPRLTRKDRAERRIAMAHAVSKGHEVHKVAAHYEVSVWTVKEACRDHGVRPPPSISSPNSKIGKTLDIYHALLHAPDNAGMGDVAAAIGVTAERVHQVLKAAQKLDLPLGDWGQR